MGIPSGMLRKRNLITFVTETTMKYCTFIDKTSIAQIAIEGCRAIHYTVCRSLCATQIILFVYVIYVLGATISSSSTKSTFFHLLPVQCISEPSIYHCISRIWASSGRYCDTHPTIADKKHRICHSSQSPSSVLSLFCVNVWCLL